MRIRINILVSIPAILSLFTLSGCGLNSVDCSLMGCNDRLYIKIVDINDEPIDSFGGEFTIGDETVEFDCPDQSGEQDQSREEDGYFCGGKSLIIEGTPPEVSITVWSEDLIKQRILTPHYQEHPLGLDCPDLCEKADEDVVLE